MKFTYDWLKDYLVTRLSAAQLADRLTCIGFEVEHLDDQARALRGFSVAEIIDIAPHPNADRLRLCTVRHKGGRQQVVCGAPNVRVGLKTIFAVVGSVIPASGMTLKAAVIRGIKSEGMLCSWAELALGKDADGIIDLPSTAKIGQSAAQALGQSDVLFDVAVLPNRGDCMSVIGLARDLAAAGAGRLRPWPLGMAAYTKFERRQAALAATRKITIDKAAAGHCAIFAGCELHDVQIVPSPRWLAQRLEAVGITRISAPVDITNYAALTFGHPMHVYDMDKLEGDIRVRLAHKGEKLAGIDERTYQLHMEDCVIADSARALGIGGVMGGQHSACQTHSKYLLLEAAWFAPVCIARTGQKLNCMSESRQRYERGVDKAMTLPVLAWAAQQIQALCGGRLTRPAVAGSRRVPALKAKAFDPESLKRLAGVPVPLSLARRRLVSLGFSVTKKNKHWQVRPPSWRYDMSDDADTYQAELGEEILRFDGLTQIPAEALPQMRAIAAPNTSAARVRVASTRRLLAARGLYEMVNWSFLSHDQIKQYGGAARLRLVNPISEDLAYMRHSLIPQLGAAAQRNLARHIDWLRPVHLFELGQVFASDYTQHTMLAILRASPQPRDWHHKPQDVRFLVKADLWAVLDAAGLDTHALRYSTDQLPSYYHPAQSVALMRGTQCLGYVGALHPTCAHSLDMRHSCAIGELYLEGLPQRSSSTKTPSSISDLPLVRRDFAFVCATSTAAADIEQAARRVDKTHIIGARIFDIFDLPDEAHKKSLALEVILRPQARTFTESEIADLCARIIAKVAQATGASLRQS